jgi:hypothetical protein
MATRVTNFKLGIGIPNTWGYVPNVFFDSFITMYRPDFTYIPAKNGPLDGLRNYIVSQAMVTGCSHLLMMDTDQKYPIDTIPKLLGRNVDVVHAKVHRRYPPFDPIMYKGELYKYQYITEEEYKDGDLVEVDASGTGCVLYNMKVFYDLEPPWFEFKKNPDPSSDSLGAVGEDIWFCHKLKEKGYKIYVDTSVKVGHLILFEVEDNFEILYKNIMKNNNKEVTS